MILIGARRAGEVAEGGDLWIKPFPVHGGWGESGEENPGKEQYFRVSKA